MAQPIRAFNATEYKTQGAETINAAANGQTTAPIGDINGATQADVKEFKQELSKSAPELERSPQKDSITLNGAEKTKEADKVENSEVNKDENKVKPEKEKKSNGIGKKIVAGVASAFLPGVGQAINGQWGKAAGFLIGAIAAPLLVGFITSSTILLVAVKLGINIASIVDAVKNTDA